MHRYTYVSGDPINKNDPRGLIAPALVIPARMIGFGAVGGLMNAIIQYAATGEVKLNQVMDAASDAMFLGLLPGSTSGVPQAPFKPVSANSVQVCEAQKSNWVPHAGGVVRQFTQEADQIYYRVYTQNPQGSFLTAAPPKSSFWAQNALALPPENTAQYI